MVTAELMSTNRNELNSYYYLQKDIAQTHRQNQGCSKTEVGQQSTWQLAHNHEQLSSLVRK